MELIPSKATQRLKHLLASRNGSSTFSVETVTVTVTQRFTIDPAPALVSVKEEIPLTSSHPAATASSVAQSSAPAEEIPMPSSHPAASSRSTAADSNTALLEQIAALTAKVDRLVTTPTPAAEANAAASAPVVDELPQHSADVNTIALSAQVASLSLPQATGTAPVVVQAPAPTTVPGTYTAMIPIPVHFKVKKALAAIQEQLPPNLKQTNGVINMSSLEYNEFCELLTVVRKVVPALVIGAQCLAKVAFRGANKNGLLLVIAQVEGVPGSCLLENPDDTHVVGVSFPGNIHSFSGKGVTIKAIKATKTHVGGGTATSITPAVGGGIASAPLQSPASNITSAAAAPAPPAPVNAAVGGGATESKEYQNLRDQLYRQLLPKYFLDTPAVVAKLVNGLSAKELQCLIVDSQALEERVKKVQVVQPKV